MLGSLMERKAGEGAGINAMLWIILTVLSRTAFREWELKRAKPFSVS